MLDRAACVRFFHESGDDEPSGVFAECLLVAVEFLKNFIENNVRPPRDKQQDLNTAVIGNAFEMSFEFLRALYLLLSHTHILSHT